MSPNHVPASGPSGQRSAATPLLKTTRNRTFRHTGLISVNVEKIIRELFLLPLTLSSWRRPAFEGCAHFAYIFIFNFLVFVLFCSVGGRLPAGGRASEAQAASSCRGTTPHPLPPPKHTSTRQHQAQHPRSLRLCATLFTLVSSLRSLI